MFDEQPRVNKEEFNTVVAFRMKIADVGATKLLSYVLEKDIRNAQNLLEILETEIRTELEKLKKDLSRDNTDLKKFQQWRILTKEIYNV